MDTQKSDNPGNDYDDLLFGVRRSVRYHSRRRRFFERFSKWCKFLSAISGAATVSAALAQYGAHWTIGFAVAVTVFSVLDLIVGSANMATLHNDFTSKFINLERDIITAGNPDVMALNAKRLDLEAQEPPVLHILNIICHNELCRAMGIDEAYPLKWYQHLFCQLFDIKDHDIKLLPQCS